MLAATFCQALLNINLCLILILPHAATLDKISTLGQERSLLLE